MFFPLASLLLVASTFALEEDTMKSHLQQHYLNQRGSCDAFQEVHGDPTQARSVLLIFTALTCPTCANFHMKVLPSLRSTLSMNHAIIIREYPTDPLALRASAVLWANGPEKASALRQKMVLLQESMLRLAPEAFLQKMKELAVAEGFSESEIEAMQLAIDDRNETGLLHRIFSRRNQDKKALGITEVPTAWVIRRNPSLRSLQRDSLQIFRVQDVTNIEEIKNLLTKDIQ